MRAILSLALGCTLAGCTLAGCAARPLPPPARPAAPVRITVLGVNDLHGAIEERTVALQTSGGTTVAVRVGGAPLLASYLARLRELNPGGTVLLNAGDMWQGSLESNYFEGRAVVLLDNALGYDATALGNHEFDYGPVGLVSLAHPGDPPEIRYGALLARRKEMHFPILAANVRGTESGVPAFAASVLLERNGAKIGVIGLSTEDTPNTTQPPNVVGLAFDPPAPAVIAAAADLRARGADAVLITGHLGGDCRRDSAPDDPNACKKDEEVMRLLDALPKGTVDGVVAGHTHQFMANMVDGVPVIESGAYGLAFGRFELDVDPLAHRVVGAHLFPTQAVCRDVLADTGSCVPASTNPRPQIGQASFLGGPIEPDPAVVRLLAPFRQEVAEMKATVIATAERPIHAERLNQSEVGTLVCEEMLAATRRLEGVPKADFAIQNTGGLRGTGGLPAGPITYGALYELLPFDNVLVTFQASGEQLEAILTAVARTGRVFQTAGLLQEVAGEGAEVEVRLYDLASGKRLGAKTRYTLVWNDFLANGGDGTREAIARIPMKVHERWTLRDAVADGLKAHAGPLNPAAHPLLDPRKPRLKRVK